MNAQYRVFSFLVLEPNQYDSGRYLLPIVVADVQCLIDTPLLGQLLLGLIVLCAWVMI